MRKEKRENERGRGRRRGKSPQIGKAGFAIV
jgi:hypothetical protein